MIENTRHTIDFTRKFWILIETEPSHYGAGRCTRANATYCTVHERNRVDRGDRLDFCPGGPLFTGEIEMDGGFTRIAWPDQNEKN